HPGFEQSLQRVVMRSAVESAIRNRAPGRKPILRGSRPERRQGIHLIAAPATLGIGNSVLQTHRSICVRERLQISALVADVAYLPLGVSPQLSLNGQVV